MLADAFNSLSQCASATVYRKLKTVYYKPISSSLLSAHRIR